MYLWLGPEECGETEIPELIEASKTAEWLEYQFCHLLLGSYWVLIGAALVLQYHATIFWRGCTQCGKYGGRPGSPWARTFGRQLIILQFFHTTSPWLYYPSRDPVRWSLGVVLGDVVFMKYFAHSLRWLQGGGWWSFWQPPYEGEKLIRNKYMDFTEAFWDNVLLASCQVALFLLFYVVVNHDKATHDPCNGIMLQWILSIMVILQFEEGGEQYQPGHWLALRERLSASGASFTPTEWWSRRALDFLVNSLVRESLLGIVPILLCFVEPLDLVKDVLAIFFICNMDDIDVSLSIDEMIDNLKHMRSRGLRDESDADTGFWWSPTEGSS